MDHREACIQFDCKRPSLSISSPSVQLLVLLHNIIEGSTYSANSKVNIIRPNIKVNLICYIAVLIVFLANNIFVKNSSNHPLESTVCWVVINFGHQREYKQKNDH
jgi:hypothetical protein